MFDDPPSSVDLDLECVRCSSRPLEPGHFGLVPFSGRFWASTFVVYCTRLELADQPTISALTVRSEGNSLLVTPWGGYSSRTPRSIFRARDPARVVQLDAVYSLAISADGARVFVVDPIDMRAGRWSVLYDILPV